MTYTHQLFILLYLYYTILLISGQVKNDNFYLLLIISLSYCK
ncbi:hypothetical protein BE25_0239 [Staphylococcus phage vB_SepM_BE25]|nr:hypothetical protein Terranova_012 [Staphylococcus phage Terranova]WEU70458.1 hypothetical protein BE24_0205 [Staphylococcus phage vB_SepM_BE24]WEU70725.1 hypothetical protein BE25_0239 [Staphylococcus phage vB_SepM_BE25]